MASLALILLLLSSLIPPPSPTILTVQWTPDASGVAIHWEVDPASPTPCLYAVDSTGDGSGIWTYLTPNQPCQSSGDLTLPRYGAELDQRYAARAGRWIVLKDTSGTIIAFWQIPPLYTTHLPLVVRP